MDLTVLLDVINYDLIVVREECSRAVGFEEVAARCCMTEGNASDQQVQGCTGAQMMRLFLKCQDVQSGDASPLRSLLCGWCRDGVENVQPRTSFLSKLR